MQALAVECPQGWEPELRAAPADVIALVEDGAAILIAERSSAGQVLVTCNIEPAADIPVQVVLAKVVPA